MDFELVQKEGLRLWEMLEGLIDGMAKRVQIIDCKVTGILWLETEHCFRISC